MIKILKAASYSDGAALDFGQSLREICAANKYDEKQQMKPLLESVGSSNADKSFLPKFLQAHPTDYSSKKLQEIIRLMREKRLPAAFKCYHNFHKVDAISKTTFSIKWSFMCIVILFFGDTKMR
ncbi:unnamed protein product [Trifolium pratense]|uniref:Uncharacterized protein n=1 Tax=Trifolium pratense TaxID=57577 RepID=A0ACB0JID3_TRIPR|nr:unnamed protein product [Trifolium pratense]